MENKKTEWKNTKGRIFTLVHKVEHSFTLKTHFSKKNSSTWEKTAKSQKPSGIAESTRADRSNNFANKWDPCFSALTNHDALLERQSGHNFSITDLPKENKQTAIASVWPPRQWHGDEPCWWSEPNTTQNAALIMEEKAVHFNTCLREISVPRAYAYTAVFTSPMIFPGKVKGGKLHDVKMHSSNVQRRRNEKRETQMKMAFWKETHLS